MHGVRSLKIRERQIKNQRNNVRKKRKVYKYAIGEEQENEK